MLRDLRPSYRRRLPHYQRFGTPIFVTFGTCGGLVLPAAARDRVLDSCVYDHGTRTDVHVAVVMPTHVHLILNLRRDASGTPYSLIEVMHGIKGSSAHNVNRVLQRKGPVWLEESFDHVLRSDEQLDQKIEYIRMNPVRARLASTPMEYRWLWPQG